MTGTRDFSDIRLARRLSRQLVISGRSMHPPLAALEVPASTETKTRGATSAIARRPFSLCGCRSAGRAMRPWGDGHRSRTLSQMHEFP
jgi:hypothetical protein